MCYDVLYAGLTDSGCSTFRVSSQPQDDANSDAANDETAASVVKRQSAWIVISIDSHARKDPTKPRRNGQGLSGSDS